MMTTKYTNRAVVDHIHDGDTATFIIDAFLDIVVTKRCRFARLNAPELPTPEGIKAKEYLSRIMKEKVILHVLGYDNYGRPLVEVFNEDAPDKCLNDIMIAKGYAVPVKLMDQLLKAD